MAKRHKDALAIIDGACNPVAIVNSIRAAYAELQTAPDFQGTITLTNDPAVQLMIHQLAYISGVIGTVHDWPGKMDKFGAAYQQCKELAGNRRWDDAHEPATV